MTATGRETAAALRGFWIVLALLFLIRLVNYLDRQTLSVLKTTLTAALGFDDYQYSWLILAFMGPYIVMYVASAWVIDGLGTRRAMTLFASVWSVASILSGFAQNYGQLVAARALLGLAEPAVFPLSQRIVLNWAPERLRALAFSIIAPAGSLGAVLAPPLVAALTLQFSWHAAFIAPGVLGVILAMLWWRYDRPGDRLGEVAAPAPATDRGKISVRDLLRLRDFRAIVLSRFISDPVWFFFLFWIPGYLQERLGLTLGQLGLVAGIPYLAAMVVCPILGRSVDKAVARGVDPARAQLVIYGGIALLMPLCALITRAPDVVSAMAIITLVTACCQAWFAGTGPLVAARVPHRLNVLASGIIGAVGASAGLLFNLVAGGIVHQFGYAAAFTALACLHPLGWLVLRLGLSKGGEQWSKNPTVA